VHIKNAFPIHDSETECHMEYLWKDASRVAELAKQIAISEKQEQDRPDQAYLAGLLHNMGLLIFLSRGGEKLARLIDQVKNTDTPVSDLEMEIFGFTRSEAAAYVLSLWKIPPRIIEAILLQNKPNDSDYDGVSALTAVHVASCLLKPSVMTNCDRLFDMNMDIPYLQRLHIMDRLPQWQLMADKILAKYA
jgi:HD-like signal output (HDOD) protein